MVQFQEEEGGEEGEAEEVAVAKAAAESGGRRKRRKKFTSLGKTNKSFVARLDEPENVLGPLGTVGWLSTPWPLCHHFITLQKVPLPLPPLSLLPLCSL